MIVFFAVVVIALVAALQGLVWLLLFLREDDHPEPKKLVLYTFGVGAFISVPVVAVQLLGQSLVLNFLPNILVLVFLLALIEEVAKFFAAYLAVNKNKEFNEPIDAMIYMVTAALGLATVENFFVLAEFIDIGDVVLLSDVLDVVVLRFVGATLLHALSSVLVGYYWAKGIIQGKIKTSVTIGIIIATIIHTIFNALVLIYEQPDLLILPSLFLLAVAIFVFKDFGKIQAAEKGLETKK